MDLVQIPPGNLDYEWLLEEIHDVKIKYDTDGNLIEIKFEGAGYDYYIIRADSLVTGQAVLNVWHGKISE